jgi:hypothetical protein
MSLDSTLEPLGAIYRSDALFRHAAIYIESHQAQHLDNEQLVRRCCQHLVATMGIAEEAAVNYAMHALAFAQGKHVPAHFDANGCTSYVVRVVDPRTGLAYSLTASDILQLAKAQSEATVDTAHSMQQCGRRVV